MELGSEAVFIPTDVSVEGNARGCVRAAVEKWGRVDVVVNNAWGGVGGNQRIEYEDTETPPYARWTSGSSPASGPCTRRSRT